MIDLNEATSMDEVEQFLIETASRIAEGHQLTPDEPTAYLNAASMMMVVALNERGIDFDDALDIIERLVYGEEGEDVPEVTISVTWQDGKFSCSIKRAEGGE